MKTKAVCHLAPVASRSWRTWSSYTAAAEVRAHPTLVCTAGGSQAGAHRLAVWSTRVRTGANGRRFLWSVKCGRTTAGAARAFSSSSSSFPASDRDYRNACPAHGCRRQPAGVPPAGLTVRPHLEAPPRGETTTNPTGQLRMFPSSYPMITTYPNLSEYSCRSAELSCAPMIPVGALPRMISHSLYDRPHALVSQTSAKFPSPVIRAARFCRNQLGNARPAPACRRLRAPARTTTNRPGQVHCCAASLRPHACMFPNSDPMITASGYAGAFLSQRWAPTIAVGACHDFPLIASVRDRQTIAPSRPTKITAAFRHVLSTSLLRSINLFSHMYYRFF